MVRKVVAGALVMAALSAGAGCGGSSGGGDAAAETTPTSPEWTTAADTIEDYCADQAAAGGGGLVDATQAVNDQLDLVRADPAYRSAMIEQLVKLRACDDTLAEYAAVQLSRVTATAPTPEAAVTTEAAPTVEPEPDGEFDYRCDYVLGDFSESASGYRFLADVTLRNTGNVGTVSRATAIWDQLGSEAVKQTKSVRVKAGGSKKVQFTVLATQNQLDLHQSADGGCRVSVRIVDTFGEAR